MVSSELVVLLIVCVGINTGSAQDASGINTGSEQQASELITRHMRNNSARYSGKIYYVYEHAFTID